MFRDGVDGVISRGKAEPGDKTMCDVWVPVVESLRQSSEQNLSVPVALEAASRIAESAAQSTITMQAAKAAPVISVNAVLVTRIPARPR
ncbi:dihydroxyacetone kinase subunit DhaL [Escherichia coli]|uniref:Dihydroxyacetone kinase subunit DhaL n=1 Tax=Escherichia coli TaxID=562 RepID=A0A376ZX16_ECOLX|nr:dihydroxyacetone kinase subunit DhaL [Escherichia coli]